jgi:hypothetical protein
LRTPSENETEEKTADSGSFLLGPESLVREWTRPPGEKPK